MKLHLRTQFPLFQGKEKARNRFQIENSGKKNAVKIKRFSKYFHVNFLKKYIVLPFNSHVNFEKVSLIYIII